MVRGVNKVFLVGHLGGDPEMWYTASGIAFCKFTLVTKESFKNQVANGRSVLNGTGLCFGQVGREMSPVPGQGATSTIPTFMAMR